MTINTARARYVCIAALAIAIAFTSMAPPALAQAAAQPQAGWVAGRYWSDIDALDKGQPLRLWMSFYKIDAAKAKGVANLLPGTMTMDEVRLGFLTLYAAQMEQLKPAVVLKADELDLYMVDERFNNPISLAEFNGTLDELWLYAKGQAGPSALDRTFENRANPLGILRTSLGEYIRRTLTAKGAEPGDTEVAAQAKQLQASQKDITEPHTGFTLLMAPIGDTSPPTQTEIRIPINTDPDMMSVRKPKNHTQAPITGIAEANEQITQLRVQPGAFLDIRLYNGNKQLTFRQKTGVSDRGLCLDLIIYGKPRSYKSLTLGATADAMAKLATYGVKAIHIRIANTGSSGSYAEYWTEYPIIPESSPAV